jgi:hypothetical protein
MVSHLSQCVEEYGHRFAEGLDVRSGVTPTTDAVGA